MAKFMLLGVIWIYQSSFSCHLICTAEKLILQSHIGLKKLPQIDPSLVKIHPLDPFLW